MRKRLLTIVVVAIFAVLPMFAQQTAGSATQAAAEPTQTDRAQAGQNSPSAELARESNAAAEGNDETNLFKHSPVVHWMASHLGISAHAEYWVLYSIDFAIIALLVAWGWKKKIPAAFRTRTANIRKTMDEAQASSADANRRLSEIEARLAKLDQEIAEMRNSAETEAAAEEARIHAAAADESHRIVEGAQMEIESSMRVAQRELKAYAADLAISLAEKSIQVDASTDRELVRNFARELGGNGTPSSREGR